MTRRHHAHVWVLELLLVAFLALGAFCPKRALAVVGPLKGIDTDVTLHGENPVNQNGKQVAQIANDYLTWELDLTTGTVMRTVPTKSCKGTLAEAVSKNIYQELQFIAKFDEDGGREKKLTPTTVTVYDEQENGSLYVEYTFDDPSIAADVKFYFAEATEGIYSGTVNSPLTMDQYIQDHGPDTHGRTYIVAADIRWKCPQDNGPASIKSGTAFMNVINHRMPFFGHEEETAPRKLVASSCSLDNDSQVASLTSLAGGMNKTSSTSGRKSPFNEVATISYDEANPFMLLRAGYEESLGPSGIAAGIGATGDGSFRPNAGAFSYIPASGNGRPSSDHDVLTAWSDDSHAYFSAFDPTRYSMVGWGYRNLYKDDEDVVPLSDGSPLLDSEFADVTTSAGQLAVVPSTRTSTGYEVQAIGAKDPVPANATAVYRGMFTCLSGLGYYDFPDGIAYLSPTISANYDTSAGGYFHVKPDGTVEHSGIRLSTPASCFFKSRQKVGAEPLAFSYKDKKLVIAMDPSDNEASVAIDIPYAQTSLETATVDTTGNIAFGGTLRVQTVFDNTPLNIKRLSYGTKNNGKFGLNGLEATLDAEKLNLYGLRVDKAKGAINTFDSRYSFELTINAYELLDFDAKLEFKKVDGGVLLPNTLYGELSVAYPGIPLGTPIPLFDLTGGGIGFKNFADSVNGDYLAIPPVKVQIAATGRLYKVIDGTFGIDIGPSGVDIAGKGLRVPDGEGMQLVDEVKVSFSNTGAKRTYKNTTYTGVKLSGDTSLSACFIRPRVGGADTGYTEFLELQGKLSLSAFGGTNAKNNQLYLVIDNTGTVKAEVSIPKNIPLFGGIELGGVDTLVSMGVRTLVPINSTSPNPFGNALKNVNGYFGVASTFKTIGFYCRAYYIAPSQVGFDTFSDEPGDIDFTTLMSQDDNLQAMAVYDENNNFAGYAIFDCSSEVQPIVVTSEPVAAPEPADTEVQGEGTQADEQLQESQADGELQASQADDEAMQDDATAGDDDELSAQDASQGNTLQISLPDGQSVEGKTALLEVKGLSIDLANKDGFVAGLAVDGQAVAEIDKTNADNYTDADLAGKILLDTNDDNTKITAVSFYLDNTKRSWTIASTYAPLADDQATLHTGGQNLYETLQDVSLTGTTLQATVANLKENQEYELHVYLGTTRGAGEHAIVEPISITTNGTGTVKVLDPISISTSGTNAPTGDYYVTATLVNKVSENLDGNDEATETVQIPLDQWTSTGTIRYENPDVPAAPTSVSATASGNETLTCTFGECTNVDGYRVRIYKDGVDTGFGYSFAVAEGESTNEAISYDATAKKYTLRLAPTAGMATGNGGIEGGIVSQQSLTAGNGYAIGVSAYRNLAADSSSDAYPVYGPESLSSAVAISKYVRPEIDIRVDNHKITANDEGIYESVVSASGTPMLYVEVTPDDNYTEDNCSIRVLSNDSTELLATDKSYLNESLPTFDGTALFGIEITNADTFDVTTVFLSVTKDDIPPLLQLDADTFETDTEGNYTISGTTDAGVTVSGSKDLDGQPQSIVAGDDGRFSLSGQNATRAYNVKRHWMRVVETQSFELDLTSEGDFNESVRDFEDWLDQESDVMEHGVDPATWEGDDTYTFWYKQLKSEPYTEASYNAAVAADPSANIEDYYTEETVPESEFDPDGADPENTSYTPVVRAGDYLCLTIQAEDENGNVTEAAANVTAHQHKLSKVAAVPSTCNSTGTREHYACSCGEKFEDELGTIPAGDLTLPINPDNHTFGAWKLTKKPTVRTTGVEERSCSRCGKKETRKKAKLKAKITLQVGQASVAGKTLPLQFKQSFSKIVVGLDAGNKVTEVVSSNSNIVKASIKGKKLTIKALKKKGTATVTVKTAWGVTAKITFKVQKGKVAATGIVDLKKSVTLKKGKKYKLPSSVSTNILPYTVTAKPKYKSSKKSVATVSSKGVVTAKGKGKATIVITIGAKKFSCKVTVN